MYTSYSTAQRKREGAYARSNENIINTSANFSGYIQYLNMF
jgi:hypothetical protein